MFNRNQSGAAAAKLPKNLAKSVNATAQRARALKDKDADGKDKPAS